MKRNTGMHRAMFDWNIEREFFQSKSFRYFKRSIGTFWRIFYSRSNWSLAVLVNILSCKSIGKTIMCFQNT